MLRLAFQKRPSSLWEWLICWWTGGPYFHVAMVFDDVIIEAVAGIGVSMVNTPRNLPLVISKDWDFVTINLTEEEENTIKEWAIGELGCGYDWWGLICAQIFKIPRESATHWFCSEFVVGAFHQDHIFLQYEPCTVNPNKLYKLVTKA